METIEDVYKYFLLAHTSSGFTRLVRNFSGFGSEKDAYEKAEQYCLKYIKKRRYKSYDLWQATLKDKELDNLIDSKYLPAVENLITNLDNELVETEIKYVETKLLLTDSGFEEIFQFFSSLGRLSNELAYEKVEERYELIAGRPKHKSYDSYRTLKSLKRKKNCNNVTKK